MFPEIPNYHALSVLLLTVVALYLFRREDIRLESSCLGVLIIVAIGFEVFPYHQPDGTHLESIHFFYGFGHEALIAVCALMIAGQGLVRTGALEPCGMPTKACTFGGKKIKKMILVANVALLVWWLI